MSCALAAPSQPHINSGVAAGPLTAAFGDLVSTGRGLRPLSLEGFSEDLNQDGFVDPIAQAAPVVHAVPVATYAAAPVVHAAPVATYATAPVVHAAPVATYAAAPALTYAASPVVQHVAHAVYHVPQV